MWIANTGDVVVVNFKSVNIVKVDGVTCSDDGVVRNHDVFGVTAEDLDCVTTGGAVGVAADGGPLYLVVEVEPNVSDFSTVLKHVVRDGDVVRSNFGRSVVVVVRGTTHAYQHHSQ